MIFKHLIVTNTLYVSLNNDKYLAFSKTKANEFLFVLTVIKKCQFFSQKNCMHCKLFKVNKAVFVIKANKIWSKNK